MEAAWPVEPLTPDAAEFVRFCYRRRKVGWPELYDEMCAVASRGLFRGWGPEELAQQGVGFGLFELPALAALVSRIVSEEHPGARERGRPGPVPLPTREPVARVVPAPSPPAAAGETPGVGDPVPEERRDLPFRPRLIPVPG